MQDKFLLFSFGRCGTTNLVEALIYSGINCICEPFKDDYNGKPFVGNEFGVEERLSECLPFDGVKTLNHQLSSELNEKLIMQFGKVVFVSRKNKLQSAISRTIAVSQKNWKTAPKEYFSLDLGLIGWHLKDIELTEQLVPKHKKILPIFYEDIYNGTLDAFRLLVDFIGCKCDMKDEYPMFDLSNRINPVDSYRKIPNIRDIIRKFGDPSRDVKLF